MTGDDNYRRALEALRRPTRDSVFADSLETMRAIITEKDKVIAALETQLEQTVAVKDQHIADLSVIISRYEAALRKWTRTDAT